MWVYMYLVESSFDVSVGVIFLMLEDIATNSLGLEVLRLRGADRLFLLHGCRIPPVGEGVEEWQECI